MIVTIAEHFTIDPSDCERLPTIIWKPGLRWDDLINLNISDLSFHNNHFSIFFKKRKNDQFQEGSWIFIHRNGSFYCPVSLVNRFLILGDAE